jgi:ferritin
MKLEIKNDQKDQKDNETTGYKPSKKVVDLLIDYALVDLADKKFYLDIANFYENKGYPGMKKFCSNLANRKGFTILDIKKHLESFDIKISEDVDKTDEKYDSELDAFETIYKLEEDKLSMLNDIMQTMSEENDFIHMSCVQILIMQQLNVHSGLIKCLKIAKREGSWDNKSRDILEICF